MAMAMETETGMGMSTAEMYECFFGETLQLTLSSFFPPLFIYTSKLSFVLFKCSSQIRSPHESISLVFVRFQVPMIELHTS